MCVCVCVCVCVAVGIIMSLRYSKRKWTFFFSAPSLCLQFLSKCRLLITLENSSGPTKCSAENACMCSLVSALAPREESVIHVIFYSAYLLLVASADNLFKQLGHSSGPAKLSCENVRLWNLIWAKFAAGEESGLFFKRTFSVLYHLPPFGGYFL